MKLRISNAVWNDLCVRAVECGDLDAQITGPGTYEVSEASARLILEDCDFQGNVTGNYIDPASSGVTRAYRALYAQIKGKL